MNKRSVAGRVEVAGGCHLDQSIMLWKVTVGRADEPTPSDTLTLSGMVGTASRGSTTRHYRGLRPMSWCRWPRAFPGC